MTRNTYYMLGLLALLALVAYLMMQRPGEQSSSGEAGEHLVNIDSLAVDKIEISSPSTRIVLEKRGVEWFVQEPVSYRADQSNVASLIHDSRNLQVKSVVSTKAEKHSMFQVDSMGTLVKMSGRGEEQAGFVIGKPGISYLDVYARRVNSDDVALISNASSYVFSRPVREWRDRTILKVPQENIKEVRFQYGDTTFVLAFRDSVWMIGRDSTQDWVVNSLLSSLADFQADDFIDTIWTKSPRITAQIAYAGAQLNFAYQKDSEKYFVRSSNSPQWFDVQSWRANQILKRKKDLVKSGQ